MTRVVETRGGSALVVVLVLDLRERGRFDCAGVLFAAVLTPNLIRWQWAAYPVAHRDRRNLLIHACTNPLFIGGFASVVGGAASLALVPALVGLGFMAGAMALQGKGHKMEAEPPAPFRSPLDVVARIFVEQLFTFPRFVLSGRFSEAWRGSQSNLTP